MDADHLEPPQRLSDPRTELSPADLVVEVRSEGRSDSTRRSAAVESLKEALDRTYQALASGAVATMDTVAVLDEVSRSRITVWLRANALQERSDALPPKTCGHSLLKFLSRGTLVLIAWMQEDGNPQITHLQQALQVLATGTFATGCAVPDVPRPAALVDAILAWEEAKSRLVPGDRARIVTQNGSVEIDQRGRIADPRMLLLDKKVINPATDMIFIVEMPDYQQKGEWQLKHGRTRVSTMCRSGTILDRFYRRELDIRPGDALYCKVEFETCYGPDYEVLDESFRIVDVLEILPGPSRAAPSSAELVASDVQVSAAPAGAGPAIDEEILPEDDMVEEVEGEFGVLTLRRLPIH